MYSSPQKRLEEVATVPRKSRSSAFCLGPLTRPLDLQLSSQFSPACFLRLNPTIRAKLKHPPWLGSVGGSQEPTNDDITIAQRCYATTFQSSHELISPCSVIPLYVCATDLEALVDHSLFKTMHLPNKRATTCLKEWSQPYFSPHPTCYILASLSSRVFADFISPDEFVGRLETRAEYFTISLLVIPQAPSLTGSGKSFALFQSP